MELAALSDHVAVAGLVFTRVSTALLTAPLTGEPRGPRLLSIGLAAWMTVTMLLIGPIPPAPESLALAALGEAALGLLLGFVVRLALLPLEIAGEVATNEAGLSMASSFDPARAEPAVVLSTLLRVVGLLLFAAAGGPERLLQMVAGTFQALPAGAAGAVTLRPEALMVLPRLLSGALLAAAQLALPILLASFLASACLAVLARAVPRLNLYSDAAPLRIGVVLLALLISLPLAVPLVENALARLTAGV